MLDRILLSVLADRYRYKQLIGEVPVDDLGTSMQWLVKSFGTFFERNPESKVVDYDVLESMVRLKMEGDVATPALQLIESARKCTATPEQVKLVTEQLYETQLASKAARIINGYQDGNEVDIAAELYQCTMDARRLLGSAAETLFKEPDMHELLLEQQRDEGLKFRQLSLQKHLKGLMPPMSLAFCSGVDFGKTSFLADALTFMAPQCAKLFPNRPIVWFSNEGITREIWPRIYSAALGKSALAMADMSADELYAAYTKAVGGDKRIIRPLDVHGWNLHRMAGVIEELNPCIVVYDMLANIKVPAGFQKGHEKLEYLGQEVRELAAIHDHIAVYTMQLSADGYDNLYPPGTALKDVKIGIQGALDVQINMGKLNDPNYANIRGLSLPKNKRKPVGIAGNMQAEIIFNPDTCRFLDN